YLRTITRSNDHELLHVLNDIRNGNVTSRVTEFLNSRMNKAADDFLGTRLFPHRRSVEDFNLRHLNDLPGETFTFETDYAGQDRYLDAIKKTAAVPAVLRLKIGALVMIRKNDPKMRFVNGSLGTVKSV